MDKRICDFDGFCAVSYRDCLFVPWVRYRLPQNAPRGKIAFLYKSVGGNRFYTLGGFGSLGMKTMLLIFAIFTLLFFSGVCFADEFDVAANLTAVDFHDLDVLIVLS